jgi:trehalose 6-phosphate synthase
MRLITCSNSAPQWGEGTGMLPRSPGGLVPILITLLQQHGGQWIFAAPRDSDSEAPARAGDSVLLHPVQVPPRISRQHYELVGIRVLLWLFHYLYDTSRMPTFDADLAEAWAGYEMANRAFADRLAAVSENSADEFILINDYHLFLVPAFLAEQTSRRASRLAFFHGIPWCEPEYFGILPPRIRNAILESLLQCDVLGFHAGRWADAFLACCARFVDGAGVRHRTVSYRDRETAVVVAPFPLDVAVLEGMKTDIVTERWQATLGRLAQGRRVVARAERLDLWKNLPRGFAAYESLLERRPDLVHDWWFCAVVTSPSRTTERSRAYQALCEKTVSRINDRFGSESRQAVTLVYPGPDSGSRNCVVAALGMSDATLVNPTFDGLNLVAKEAMLLAEKAPLLLSVNSGVHEQLAPYVMSIHPFDLESTGAALAAAMDSAPSATAAGSGQCRELLRKESLADWLGKLFPAP